MFWQEVKNVEAIKQIAAFAGALSNQRNWVRRIQKKEKSGKNMQKILSPEKMNPFIEKIIFSFEDDAAEQNEDGCKESENRLQKQFQ